MTRLSRLILIALVVAGAACSWINRSKGADTLNMPLSASSSVPGAEGLLAVRSADNGNTRMDLTVHHLAPPDRVVPNASVYVVWLKPLENTQPPQNIGVLAVNRNLDGALTTITPYRQFELFVTAEPTRAAGQPTGNQLLQTRITQP